MQGVIYALVAAGGAAIWHLIQSRLFGGKPVPAPGTPATPTTPATPGAPAASSQHPYLQMFEQELMTVAHETLTNLWQQVLRNGVPGVPVLAPPTVPVPTPGK